MITPKPLSTGGRVAFWFLIVFAVVIGVGGGTALVVEGLNGATPLRKARSALSP